MGTNFYCRRINKEARDELKIKFDKLHSDLIESINDIQLNYRDIINNFLWDNEGIEQEIHLGKRSCGWQFLWDYHNGIYFQPTLESIKKFLSQDGLVIYDEYGEKFTLDQFINEEVGSSLYKDKNHTDGFGDPSLIDWHKYYFTNDGLRFSKFEDFS